MSESMPVQVPATTALGGALVLADAGWQWHDGTPGPRVRTLRLRDLAPNWRCQTYGNGACYVEIPAGWRHLVRDPDVRAVVAELIRDAGRSAQIFADGLAEIIDDHRLTMPGTLVPVAAWDALMTEPCGVSWDRADEPAILARARALGWQQP